MMSLREALDEFLNTFPEIHYFVGGIVVGWILGSLFTLLLIILFIWSL